MPRFESFDEVESFVQSNGGIVTVTMEDLRNAHGVGRLGIHVRRAIHSNLAGKGIGHWPKELPEYAHEPVRLYSLGGRFAECVNDIYDLTSEADERLRDIFVTNYEEIIQKIRELVCN
ncbi:MAG: hypothetical protein OXI16_09165 [Chloroflexota bacterium]|nr:hypothetical protein [Chloroflexota bacterium]MDE2687647.1 hypothetical protein [Chloroflexota bacterium]